MPTIQIVTIQTHNTLKWQRFSSYQFSGKDSVAALVAHEFGKACVNLPIAFIWQGERFLPVAVQGVELNSNLFVAPDGRWLGGYTPAVYRSYPFGLAPTQDEQLVLCVDQDSGLIFDEGDVSNGETGNQKKLRFFDEQGQLDPSVREILTFLEQIQASRAVTERICSALAEEGLIVPWNAVVKCPDGPHEIPGLYRIDEVKLQGLTAEALFRLNQVGALSAAYCQLVSMQHIQTLGALTQLNSAAKSVQANKSQSNAKNSGDGFLKHDGALLFGGPVAV
jgi:hypothetical protein